MSDTEAGKALLARIKASKQRSAQRQPGYKPPQEADKDEAASAGNGTATAAQEPQSAPDYEAEIQRLAALPELDAALQIKASAARLGTITATELSKLVQKARTAAEKDKRRQAANAAKARAANAAKAKAAAKAAADAAKAKAKAATDAVKAAEKAKRDADRQAAIAARKAGTTTPDGARLPAGFTLDKGSFWYRPPPSEKKIPEPFRVCDVFRVLARTSDEADNDHGLLLRWRSVNGADHQWAVPKHLTHLAANDIAAELERGGLSCETHAAAHEALKSLLSNIEAPHHVRSVDRAGWHDDIYLLPDGRVFGAKGASPVVLQSERAVNTGRYASAGSLSDWQQHVANYAVGNRLMVLAICIAFAGPLLAIIEEPSGGFHLHGGSRTGKTTIACCMTSVTGPGNKNGPMYSWRFTSNALEIVAAEHNDGSMVLDEFGQIAGREAGEIVYLLANERGKGRSDAKGRARQILGWRILYLSTGEVTLQTKMAEDNKNPRPGQELRLTHLLADAGAGKGVFENLYGATDPGTFAEMLARNTGTYYGTPMQAYLDALVHDRAKDATALLTRLRSGRSRFLTKYLPKGADGQVRSVAARFALIASAGELARSYDILPWPQGEAWNAVGACFKAWLAERGGADAGEELVARQTVEAFLAAHGAARFVRLIDRNGTLEVERPEQQVRDRAGFVRPAKHGGDGHEFLIFSATWTKDVCQGLDPKVVAATGVKQGWLIPDNNGKSSRPERVPGHALMRYYVVRETVISGATAGP